MGFRVCKTCGEAKPPGEFYAQRGGDGLRLSCKACLSQRSKEWRKANPGKKQRGRDDPAKKRERNRRWREADPQRWVALALKHREDHPEKFAARETVRRALRSGRLVRPGSCSRCETPGRVEAHHSDYDEHLAVEWLCKSCHVEAHAPASASA